MTTDTEALICDCPAENMPFGRCCKLEPLTALRAAFESTVSEWGWDTYRNKAGDYATTSTNGAWAGYQVGHAAAKTETAAVGARGISLARELRDQADFDEAESVFGGGSRTRELMREAADALHAGAEERGE